MKECFNKILSEVDSMIDEIDLFGYDIIETSLSMIYRLQNILTNLRILIQKYE